MSLKREFLAQSRLLAKSLMVTAHCNDGTKKNFKAQIRNIAQMKALVLNVSGYAF